jgi:DNA modification methylase
LKNSIYSTKTFGYLKTGSATKLSKYISKASVDYIFTDPPYGDSVPYLEYSTLWNNWIHEKIKSEDEIIISDSDVRTKDILSYTTGLKESMLECYRVLKKGKWISITFNNRNFDVWKSLINSINEAGFEIINAIYQVPAVIPAKSQLSKSGSGVGDLIINARKPTKKKQKGRKLSKKQFEKTVLKIADKCIGERNGVASTDQINRSVMLELIGKGVVDFKNDDLTKIMRKKFHSNKGFWAHKNTYRKENYDQIDDSIKSITSKCLSNGISDRKKIIQKVFNELTGSRTPDISEINLIIDSALRSGNTLNLFS